MTYEPNDPTHSGPVFEGGQDSVRLSRNEIESLSMKAARGAGMPWGLAEEAGWAVGWLHAHGLDGASALLAHLAQADGMPWQDVSPAVHKGEWVSRGGGLLCPVAVGTALSDYCGLPEGSLAEGGLAVGPVSQPVLLLPFLSRVAGQLQRAVACAGDGFRVTVSEKGHIAGNPDQLATLSRASIALTAHEAPAESSRQGNDFACGRSTLTGLNDLAMRTTVPPSAKSRADAGAATTDND